MDINFYGLALAVLVVYSFTIGASASANPTFNGEDYFRGLMFGQGEVGEMIGSQLSDQKMTEQANTKEGNKVFSDIVDHIKKEDPTYFNEPKSSIESKDPQKLVDNMVKGEELIIAYAKENESSEIAVSASDDKVTPSCGVVAIYVAVVGGYLYVVAVNGAAVQTGAAITTGIWKYVAFTSDSQLEPYHIEAAAAETISLLNN